MNHISSSLVYVFLTLLCATATASATAAEKKPAAIQSLRIIPIEIRIGGGNPQQQLLITGQTKQGHVIDVTHQADVRVEDQRIALVSDAVVRAAADGRTKLLVQFGGVQESAAIVVEKAGKYPPIHFTKDLIPLFSKLGCNSAGCHGKQGGQNGFQLSVFGFDPRADYNALVKAARGRRIFPADPVRSLLAAKATGQAPHGGGQRTPPGSLDHRLLVQWVRQGSPWGDENSPHLTAIQVKPKNRIGSVGGSQQILATAVYSDGSTRDVTAAAAYTCNAETIAQVNQNGLIRIGGVAGEAAITVNYMGRVGVSRVLAPKPNAPSPFPVIPVHNQIDTLVWAKLKQLGVVPADLCDDNVFLRRVYLDVIGMLPEPNQVRAFLNDSDPHKRKRVIEELLRREEYADYWALKWADILLVDRNKLGDRGAFEFHRWLREQFAQNRPYDQWVRELVTASGNSGKYGPVNFFRAMQKPEELAKTVSQAFLGVRIDCAQCHHHPFDRWGQEDFYGLAGFFNGLSRKPLGAGRELVYHTGAKPMTVPLLGKLAPVRPLGGERLGEEVIAADPRVPLAEWLTAKQNPWFARLAANRLWKHFLGRGLIEPEDDLRSTNPPTNEPLLNHLAGELVHNQFDLKHLMRRIMESRVYQLSSQANASNGDDEQNFSRHYVRRLPAEALLDAISQVTGSPERFAGMPPGTRAAQLWNNRMPSYFLEAFGRSLRESPCECGKFGEPTMAQALHLMNAPEIEEKISRPSGRVAKLIASGAPTEQIIEELCLAAMGRYPGTKEKRAAAKLFAGPDKTRAAEDFLWTLLNSYDFLFIR